ncbi:uncharacterized protein CCOS01_02154 [Colletotrichum costaricense]|uniref:C2H2-type domain-containing protein n=1 Tax=Colletotrichum costaricense TaxID=1209916 RepID=A0AAI9Z8L6_9PEZI|nr:uncharacterized protein CCOS01_02154 [Colletotrichum costaricense]KAK1536834.1 hypothetical protein CCOS01_02154 [Colletotrichum costaricense]
MPASDTKAKLRCEAPGCDGAYSSPSNLKRHINSKHRQAVQMSCGKSFPNHQSNIKRHKEICGCTVLVQPLVPAGGTDPGVPTTAATTNTMTTLAIDDTLDMMLNDFKDAYYPVDNNLFGPFQ